MATKEAVRPLTAQEEASVRQQLDRVLGSTTFQQVDRLKRFLSFIVQEALAGRSEQLKEYVVGVQVFGKEDTFDPRTDPVVRVQARRLRARLDLYYAQEGLRDEVLIELPKGRYAPQITTRTVEATARRTVQGALVGRNTVAVLPFSDHSASRDLDYFCQGMRDEIVHALSGLPSLRVLTFSSLDAMSRSAAQGERPGDAVAMIVAGSVRRSGDTVRITTQLIDGTSQCYVWSETVDAPVSDALSAQERVARAVANKVRPGLAAGLGGTASHRPSANLVAYNLYLQGRYHLSQRTEEGLLRAVDFFTRAIIEDAQYALAHSGLADAYQLLNHYGARGPADIWTKVAASAAAGVMLDPNSAEARTSLAHMKATQDWDWSGAEREFQHAISLDARYATAHHWFVTSCLLPLRRFDEALEQIQLAAALDPVSSIIARDVATVFFYRKEHEQALEQCDHAIALNPHFAPAYFTLGLIQEQLRDFDESASAFQRAAHLSPRSPRMQAALARNFALNGQSDDARHLLRQLLEVSKDRYVAPADVAFIHFALGQMDEGFTWLAKAVDERCFELLFVRSDPRFDSIKADARFDGIVRALHFE